jgi:hypothetical protein
VARRITMPARASISRKNYADQADPGSTALAQCVTPVPLSPVKMAMTAGETGKALKTRGINLWIACHRVRPPPPLPFGRSAKFHKILRFFGCVAGSPGARHKSVAFPICQ